MGFESGEGACQVIISDKELPRALNFSELATEYSTYSRIIMQSQAFLHYFILKPRILKLIYILSDLKWY